jgi:putative transposase
VIQLKAFRYLLEPALEQLQKIRRFAGCRRYIFNRFLAERETEYAALGEVPDPEVKKAFNRKWSYEGMAAQITRLRAEMDWLDACPVHALQNGAKDLQDAYLRWWEGLAEKPRFKKKNSGHDTWRESDPALLDVNGRAVKLPKIGWVKARISKPFRGILRQATVKQDGERWYVSISSQETVGDPRPVPGAAIGLDMGVIRPITDSNGKTYDITRVSAEERSKLRLLSRHVSRKKKGSNNRRKAQARLNAFKRKMSRRVLHEMHRTTTQLAKTHGMVAYEDMRVKNMTASAAGSLEKPGRNVAAKSGLNRAILEVGWGEAKRQLEYKCAWYGSRAVKVPPHYSSQECSQCGYTHLENRPTQALFRCGRCGYEANADHNAAQVVLKRGLELVAAGHAVNACGEHVRPLRRRRRSTKQEPTLRKADGCPLKQGIPGL